MKLSDHQIKMLIQSSSLFASDVTSLAKHGTDYNIVAELAEWPMVPAEFDDPVQWKAFMLAVAKKAVEKLEANQ